MQRYSVLLRAFAAQTSSPVQQASGYRRAFATGARLGDEVQRDSDGHIDVEKLLSEPAWSVGSLIPAEGQQTESPAISSRQLHHLLRLSALPLPKDAQEEAMMLKTLSSQLHFVKDIQQVDTTGVEPLRSLRDETAEGEKEAELGMAAMKGALEQEDVRGKYHRRIRRRRRSGGMEEKAQEGEHWDPLSTAGKKVGRFFVVEGGKDG
ncbi:hypothetical protein LTR85_006517 [Meristemomyces frigidus]|nr:hypothetical protein LTR85_006517 [Meristemomyces frigidus]